MNSLIILVVRLILGVAMGVVIARVFKPDWPMLYGALLGVGLVAAAYLMEMIRSRNRKP